MVKRLICDHSSRLQVRRWSIFETEQLPNFLEGESPLIVVAYLNDFPEGSAYKLMRTRFHVTWVTGRTKGHEFSYPADRPLKRIDHIFHRAADGFRAKSMDSLDARVGRLPLVAKLEIS